MMDSMTDSEILRMLYKSVNIFSQQTNQRLTQVESTVTALVEVLKVKHSLPIPNQSVCYDGSNTHTQMSFGNSGAVLREGGNDGNNNNNNQQYPPLISSSSPISLSSSLSSIKNESIIENNNNNNCSSTPSSLSGIICSPNDNNNNNYNGSRLTLLSPKLQLKMKPIPQRWYQNRPFPEFEVSLVDLNTNMIYEETRNFKIYVRLLSGSQEYVDHLLGNPSSVFDMDQGKANIFGLKISAVSSRNGGHFSFSISLHVPPTNNLSTIEKVQILSNNFQIFSERLITEKKAISILELQSTDLLSRVPGIGKKYATKLFERGIRTVRDLAEINNSNGSKEQRAGLLAAIRKERGSLTETKFFELVRDAKTVLQREQEQENKRECDLNSNINIITNNNGILYHNNNNNYHNHLLNIKNDDTDSVDIEECIFSGISQFNNNHDDDNLNNNNNNNNNNSNLESSRLNSGLFGLENTFKYSLNNDFNNNSIGDINNNDDFDIQPNPAKKQKLCDVADLAELDEDQSYQSQKLGIFGEIDVDNFFNPGQLTDDDEDNNITH